MFDIVIGNDMGRKFSVVTTFHRAGYELYGSRMIDTFLSNWPQEVDLTVYSENCEVLQMDSRLQVRDLMSSVPALAAFKNKWSHDARATGRQAQGPADRKGKQPGIGFKWDAVRFSHKIYSVCDCAKSTDTDVLIWMDADTVCHSSLSLPALEDLVPADADICFLGREGKYTECGLYALNLRSTATRDFLSKFQWTYDNAEQGIFTMQEWHDSFVFDQVRKRCKLAEHDWSSHLIRGEGHPLINSRWGAYLDHLKGKRKQQGRSLKKDLRSPRTEPYWIGP
jgi:hypothetical protein